MLPIPMDTPLISFATHGRNDGFMGDFLWRISTCINKIARNFAALGHLDEIEILVGDWGSERQLLREAMVLEDEACRVTRFCTVPVAVAARLNGDGDYGYSPAANIPIRRAKGRFIFSMDADAWMPVETAELLWRIARGEGFKGVDLDRCFFWASRQHIPFPILERSPSIEELDRFFIEHPQRLFWTGKCNMNEFRGGAVALFGKREHFHAIRGYNEELVHWGWHDVDIHCRLAMSLMPRDLWDLGAKMYHLEHYPKRGGAVAGGRKLNPQVFPTQAVVNAADWGAVRDPVEVSPASRPIQSRKPVSRLMEPRNIVISGTNFWNPGDDFVREGVLRILQQTLPETPLNYLFYNFNADFFPQDKFVGISNMAARGDLEKCRDCVDAVVIAGLSAGDEIKDLYRWVIDNHLEDRMFLIGAGYENSYVAQHIQEEPEATIFKKARMIIGRTKKTPALIQETSIPYVRLNCPAILSVPEVKEVAAGKRIERIGFSIQLPPGEGLVNHSCASRQYELAISVLRDLAQRFEVEVIAHHKSEYFHFLKILRGTPIPVRFSSFYQDLYEIYRRMDLVVTTRLHSSLFANGHGIPGIILNDTDRHTHTVEGFPHSVCVNSSEAFAAAFLAADQHDLAAVARESQMFKERLLKNYVEALAGPLNTVFKPRQRGGRSLEFKKPMEREFGERQPEGPELPIHFFTLVLNGLPFIEYHIEVFKCLPFRWHWHIIEGVADLNHDTSWSKVLGGRISDELHRNGLSLDGTTAYLDALQRQFPDQITLYRPPPGSFWDGKQAMANAPLSRIREECLLWEIDVDEFWTADQIQRARRMFVAHPEKTAAFYYCHYFVTPDLVTTTRNTYGNLTAREWQRTWRFLPGDRWALHEPPQLVRLSSMGEERDVAAIQAFTHAETERLDLVFQHYAYATEAQLRFKEIYYGYVGAVDQWKKLLQAGQFPVKLADYFPWVQDAAEVDTVQSQGVVPLAPPHWFSIRTSSNPSISPISLPEAPKSILWVRTDSIGDAVLSAAMLPWIQQRYPGARLSVLCQEHVAELYAYCPHVASIVCFNKSQALEDDAYRETILADIGSVAPDLILNGIYSRETYVEAMLQQLQGIPAIGIEGDLANISSDKRAQSNRRYAKLIPNTRKDGDLELEHHRDFLAGLGIQSDPLGPVVWLGPEDEEEAAAVFAEHQLDSARTVALFPGAQHAIREYPRYAEALRDLAGFRFLILGGQKDVKLCADLAAQLPGDPVNLAGHTSLRKLAALIRRCRLYVGADTGAAHMACALGIPNVVVLGGGGYLRFFPYSPLTTAASLPLECLGCGWQCPYPRPHCIKDLFAEVLAEAVRQTLAVCSDRPRIFFASTDRPNLENKGPRWLELEQVLHPAQARLIAVKVKNPPAIPERKGPLRPLPFIITRRDAPSRFGESMPASHPDLAGTDQSQRKTAIVPNPCKTHTINMNPSLPTTGPANANQRNGRHVTLSADEVVPARNAATSYLEAATASYGRGDLKSCCASLERALEMGPETPELRAALGSACMQLGRLPEARQHFERSIELDSRQALLHVQLAAACLQLGEAGTVERELHQALALDPRCSEALNLLADYCLQSGRHTEAARHYHALLTLNPDHAAARQAMDALCSRDPDILNSWNAGSPQKTGIQTHSRPGEPKLTAKTTHGASDQPGSRAAIRGLTSSRSTFEEESLRNQEEVNWWMKFIFEYFDTDRRISERKFLERFERECTERWNYICQELGLDAHCCSEAAVLDVGNGPCGLLNFIPARIKVGVDPNNELYHRNGILYNLHRDIVLLPVRAEAIPLLDGSFDFVTCVNVLDHTNDPAAILAGVHRLLKPGGVFWLSVDMRKPEETQLVHPHAINEKIVSEWAKPMACIASRVDKPCYDEHPTNKRLDAWFQKLQ